MRGSFVQVRSRRGRDGCVITPAVSVPPPIGPVAPHFSLHEIEARILEEFETARNGLALAAEAALACDAAAAQVLIDRRAALEARHADLHSRLLSTIALQWPVGGDLRLAIASLNVNDRLERIGTLCSDIAELSLAHAPSAAQLRRLGSIARLAQDGLRDAEASFADRHYAGPWRRSEPDHLRPAATDPTSREVALIARAFERIGDNAADIARQAAFAATGTFGAT